MNDLQTLENLLGELLNGVQQVLASGEKLSDQFQGMLAQTLDALFSRIQMLKAEGPVAGMPPISLQAPQLEPGPFPSSNVNSFKYNPDTEDLYVKFHGPETADNGPTYLYKGIPKFIYDIFSRGAVAPRTSGENQYHRWIRGVTPSLGASLYALIREGGYPYQKLS